MQVFVSSEWQSTRGRANYMTMIDSKPWYASKTVWGSVLAIVSAAVPAVGNTLDAVNLPVAIEVLSNVGGLIGGGIALLGRFQAVKTIEPPATK